VLVIAPHPDDELAGCGGAMVLHRERGDQVVVCYVTDGRRSRAHGLSPDDMAARRRAEAEGASRSLGAEGVWLGLPEGGQAVAEVEEQLRRVLADHRPQVVYAPSLVDYHPEHWRVAAGLAAALRDPQGVPPRVRAFQVQVPLTPLLTNLVAPLFGAAQEVRQAAESYVTQLPSLERCWRMKRYVAAYHHLASGEAEAFWEMSTSCYRELHPTTLPATAEPFQGVWHLPFKDIISYTTGLDRRRRLREASTG